MSHHILTLTERDVETITKAMDLHITLLELAHKNDQVTDQELLFETRLVSNVVATICNPHTLGEPMAVSCEYVSAMAISMNDMINQTIGCFAQRLISDDDFMVAMTLLREVADQLIHGEEVHAPEVPASP